MELIPTTIKNDNADALLFRALANQFTYELGNGALLFALRVATRSGFDIGRRGYRMATIVVDDLRVDVCEAAIYAQSRLLACPVHALAYSEMASDSCCSAGLRSWHDYASALPALPALRRTRSPS